MENNHPLMSSLAKASGALLIISVFINLITLITLIPALVSGPEIHPLVCYFVIDYVDTLFILGPEVMWTYMFVNVTKGPGNSMGMGPGLILLWVAFVAKILVDLRIVKFVMEGGFCGKRLHERCRPRRRSNAERRIWDCLK